MILKKDWHYVTECEEDEPVTIEDKHKSETKKRKRHGLIQAQSTVPHCALICPNV
jgi:hypothetical protein